MTVNQAIKAGHALAEKRHVDGWRLGGFFFPLIVIPLAHLRNPTLPVEEAIKVVGAV